MKNSINIVNKKAKFEYEFIQIEIAGVSLLGSEVKSIRGGKVSISESYCYFNNNELFVKGMNITSNNVAYSHEASRERKILMKKKELRKLEKELINGLTIVPYRVFSNDRGLIKMEIVLAKGKNLYDKRNSLKEKDINREMMRGL